MIELEYKFALFKSRVNTITGNALIQLDELKIDIEGQFDALLPEVLPEPPSDFLQALLLNEILQSNAARQQGDYIAGLAAQQPMYGLGTDGALNTLGNIFHGS